jgi:hypothetical protein
MKKTKNLSLSRETLLRLVAPEGLREVAGGLTTPRTNCSGSACLGSCTCPG